MTFLGVLHPVAAPSSMGTTPGSASPARPLPRGAGGVVCVGAPLPPAHAGAGEDESSGRDHDWVLSSKGGGVCVMTAIPAPSLAE